MEISTFTFTFCVPWGTFNDYVDTILPFFDHVLPPRGHFNPEGGQKWHFVDHISPLLVHVVVERPL